MMRGGKDEEKAMSPMFPRLHVNDTEKGGPRAPPRNKMALYEQLSIPSHRFNSGSAPMSPLPPSNRIHLVPSTSSNHDGSQERSVFNPICNSPEAVPTRFPEKLHSYSFNAVDFDISMKILEQNSIKPTNLPTLNGTNHLSSSAKYESSPQQTFSNFKDPMIKKRRGAEDVTVPTSAQSEITPRFSTIEQSIDRLSSNSSVQLQTVFEKERKGIGTTELKSRQHVTNQVVRNQKMSYLGDVQSEERTKRIASIFSTRDKFLADTYPSPLKDKISESLRRIHTSSNQENRSISVKDKSKLHALNPRLHQESVALRENISPRYGVLVESPKVIGRSNASKVRVTSCSKPSLGHDHRSSSGQENGSKCCEDKECDSLQEGDVNNNSDTSMVDCLSCLNISPDDVVEVIGEKQFWKARKVLVNQQRVFAVQVFELHRLIKVQQMIAGSPHLLVEDNLSLGKPLLNISPRKKFPSYHCLEPPPLIAKPKDHSQKPNSTAEYAAENVIGKLPLSSFNKDSNVGLITPGSNHVPSSANIPLTSPWCYHPPPGNQWLIPMMSPSQGLVYKPYSGPCPPPSAGFMAPIYGSCGPMALTPENGDFLNTAYAVPASYQQGIGPLHGTHPFRQTYFPPYGMPTMSPSISTAAFEQMSPFTGARLNELDNQFSTRDTNFNFDNQSSCNISSQKSGIHGKHQLSKYNELWGSTASSPSEREQGDAIPLFPMEPMVQVPKDPVETHSSKQQTRVIKVVPHNPRLATESAARIFRSIQEEREQCV